MGIALGYAFLVAIAGGLAAICFAQYLEMLEENAPPASRDGEAARDRLLHGAPSMAPGESSLRRRPVPASPHSTRQLSLTSK
jgi:hypothetical protein